MQPTETSGVSAEGFVVTGSGERINDLLRAFARMVRSTSPLTYAVGCTATIAATLFVVTDAIRTIGETEARAEILARAMSLAPAAAGDAADFAELHGTAGTVVWSQLAEAPVNGFASSGAIPVQEASLLAHADTTSFPADLAAAADRVQTDATGGVVQRGLLAFSAAFLVTGFAYRRRTDTGPATPADGAFGDLVDSVPFGLACWSASGKLVTCNDHYRARLGPDTELSGASYEKTVRQLVQGGTIHLLGEDDHSRLLELRREDGWLLIEERPLPSGGFITLVTDVTAQRRVDLQLAAVREEQRLLARRFHEEKLRAEAASRSKTAFLAHLSHDIRTPLNHIIGFAELIRHQTYGPLGDARYIDYVETIKGSGEQLLSFFASILDLAELESGRRILRREDVRIDDMLETLARRYRSQAGQAGIALAVGAPCGASLSGDRFCLERMLGNLVENALRFTPSGGRIMLTAHAALDGVVLEISDTGIGMPPERVSALSQTFAFGDATFSKEHTGAGLGIPIARTIAELSGGHLAIDSRPGLGTTVAISLPLQQSERTEAA